MRRTRIVISLVLGIILILPVSISLQQLMTGTVEADQDGDYTYTISGSPSVATITEYTGIGGAITIPSTLGGYPVAAIGDTAFFGKESLTSVIIPNGVTSIGYSAFYSCSALTSVTIPNSVTTIEGSAFISCSSLTSVTIPNSVTTIGVSAFEGCSSMTSVTIPNGVTYIENSVFMGCSSLTSVTIPNSVTSIGMTAFSSCTALTSVTIPNSVTSIEMNAFEACDSLTSVTIPGSVTSIGGGVFMGCTSLTSVTLSDGVKSISSQMFYGCHALTSVIIPSTVERIGEYAFLECISLTDLTIPEGVTSIDGFAFQGSALTSLTIPGTVESVGWYEFTGCSALTSVTFSEGVKSIGPWEPFGGCTSLTTFNIPSSLTSISAYGFQQCPSLTSINVDEDNPAYSSIDGVLYDKAVTELISCPKVMTSVTIPDSVTSIGEYAFGECKALTSITFQGLVAPTNVGPDWIYSTPSEIRGHAYAASNFPPTGEVWNGLTMGEVISATPGAPTGLVANPGNNQVTLNWTAPLDYGGEEIDHYIVYVNDNDVAHVEGMMKTITGLTNGVSYNFAVAAHTGAGTGARSDPVSATPRAPLTLVLPPNAPTDLTATPDDGQVHLSWAAPNDDGGSPITGYNLSWGLTSAGPYTSIVIEGTSYLHEGLENGPTYYYKVAAINAIGESDMTEVASATPLASIQLPSPPLNVVSTVINGNVSLTWTAPADGGQISSYKIYRGTSPATIGLLTSISETSFLDTNVSSNQTYYYQVSAIGVAGEGERSAEVNVAVPTDNAPATDSSPNFLDTLEGQVAIAGLAIAGVGAVTYALWRWRRP